MLKNIKSKSCECCIIGAGPAGLGAALELVNHGITDIIIIDKNKIVGGLARTNIFEDVRFDIGPHRFFSKNKEVNKIWHDTLGVDFHRLSRLTKIYYKNIFFNYPIRFTDVLMKLNPYESLEILFSFVISQINKKAEIINFEEWIIQKFGRKLYETFFKVYSEKVWGIPCSQIGVEWATQRIKGLDALKVLKNALLGGKNKKIKNLIEEFFYPTFGAGQMYEAICDKIVSQGAELLIDSKVVRFNRQDCAIKSIDVLISNCQEINITAKHFFSSIPLAHYFKMLNPQDSDKINEAAEKFRYRDHISVDLVISKDTVFSDQWLYVHSPNIQAARITNYNNFSKSMIGNKNKSALSVEYFLFKNLGLWNESDKSLIILAINELERMRLIKSSEVENAWVVRETETYPIYYLGFQEYYNLLKLRLDRYLNFYSIGRAGMHKYNNQDHSLISGVLSARNYLKLPGYPYRLWDINIDAEYFESA